MKKVVVVLLLSAAVLITLVRTRQVRFVDLIHPQLADNIPNFTVDGVPWHVWHEQTVTRPNPYDGSTAYFFGYTMCNRHILEVKRGLPPCYEREVVMHELMHAAMCDWRQFGQSFEHTQFNGHEAINRLAPHVMHVLADNPRLAAYFAEAPNCYQEKPH